MAETLRSQTEESGSTPVEPSAAPADTKASPRAFLNSARRNLSEDELKTPGAIRLLISEIERLDDHCGHLQVTYETYQDLRVTHATLAAKVQVSRWNEILSGLCLAIGSFGVATGQRLLGMDGSHDAGIGIIVVSALLIVAGILSKVLK